MAGSIYELLIPTLVSFVVWPLPLYLLLGAIIGMIFGIIPGLSGGVILAVLLPITYAMPSETAIVFLMGAGGTVAFAGSISAILIGAPGTNQNVATLFDGFPLARQGKAGLALGASATASFMGALFGALILTLILPFGRIIILAISFPEYFMLAIFGLSLIVVVSRSSLLKGFIAAAFGMQISLIGYCNITGATRFTFNVHYLYEGISVVAVLIGLFAITELIDLFEKKETIAQKELISDMSGILKGCKAVFENFWLFLRCSAIGTLIGMLPGVGAAVSNLVAYFHAMYSVKEEERKGFGKGDIRGVIAPEAANDATDGGALVPTLIFGIPGSIPMLAILTALQLQGIMIGPRLMIDNPSIVLVLIYTLVAANFIASSIGLAFGKYLIRITIIPHALLVPIVISFAFMGVYSISRLYGDVIVVIIFSVIGYMMKKLDIPRIPLIIALLLGPLVHKSFHQTLMAFGVTGFFTRPISLGLIILLMLILFVPFIKKRIMFKSKGVKSHD